MSMAIKTKKALKRWLSLTLALAIALLLVPTSPTRALKLEAGTFNPNAGEVEIKFDLDFTQRVTLEILVDGAHFGLLFQDKEFGGRRGDITPRDPCDAAYTVPALTIPATTAGVAIEGAEYTIEPQEGHAPGAGYYVVKWKGQQRGLHI